MNLSVVAVIFLAVFTFSNSSWAARLACFYFDKNDPLGSYSSLKLFGPTLPFEWAKQGKLEDFIKGTIDGGFYEIANLSRAEATDLCQETLKNAYPKGQLKFMHMAVKTSLWGKLLPALFIKGEKPKYSKLVIIGDSLSDQGRIKEMLKFLPSKPYFAGRFSNGDIWVDYLHESTGIAIQNFATAGSLSGRYYDINLNEAKPWTERVPDDLSVFFSGTFQDQFESFRKSLSGSFIKDDTIFLIWGGSNDYLTFMDHATISNAFLDEPESLWGYPKVVNRVTDNIIGQIKNLHALGARNFIIPNLPSLGKLPRMLENKVYARGLPQEKRLVALSTKMNSISVQHNAMLEKKIDELRTSLNLNITLVDVFRELERVPVPLSYLAKEISYEGTKASVGQACYSNYSYYPFGKASLLCQAQEVFFWDGVHPTTYGHCLLAFMIQQAASQAGLLEQTSLNAYLALFQATWLKPKA